MVALQKSDLRQLNPRLEWIPETRLVKTPLWSRTQLAGRLCEISSVAGGALLTAAFRLVLDAQFEGEPVAWISTCSDTFFAPDVVKNGVDLNALVVIQVPKVQTVARAADHLLKSGAFGLIVMDLNSSPSIPIPMQMRLAQQARIHETAILFLTSKTRESASLGPMISLRGQITCRYLEVDHFQYEIEILKDKLHGPGWRHIEICHGTGGLH